MSQSALDLFGELLIRKGRDESISDWQMILSRHSKGERADNVLGTLQKFSKECSQAVENLVPDIVDTVLHHLPWLFEQDERIALVVRSEPRTVSDLWESRTVYPVSCIRRMAGFHDSVSRDVLLSP